MPFDDTGNLYAEPEEHRVTYPKGLPVLIDGVEFKTVGEAIEERRRGYNLALRRWIAVAPSHQNGSQGRQPARLVDEEGLRGLRQRAERKRLQERS